MLSFFFLPQLQFEYIHLREWMINLIPTSLQPVALLRGAVGFFVGTLFLRAANPLLC